ncbi:MAG: hypothetical protein ACRDHN_21125 [Thermomicrobiales bacterium]
MSADGRYLYLSSILPRKVARLSLPSMKLDLEIDLGKPTWIAPQLPEIDVTMFAGSVAVDALNSRRFAVSMLSSMYPVLQGLRVYEDATVVAEIRWKVDSMFGDVVAFDGVGKLVTARSATTPDTVARLRIEGANIVEVDSLRVGSAQNGGGSASISLSSQAFLTAGGSKVELPGFTYRGQLPPLTFLNQGDPFPLIKGCVFANNEGTVAACFSQWDADARLPTFRTFVLYELSGANPFLVVGLDQTVGPVSEIVRFGPGQFAVSVGVDATESGVQLEPFSYLSQNKRIYFLSGIDTTYRP